MQLIVRPNFELMQRIMMYGNFIEVIKPEWLRKEVSKLLTIASKKNSE